MLERKNGHSVPTQTGNRTEWRMSGFHYPVDQYKDPRKEAYGTVVVFEDLYGNKWDLVQPTVKDTC